VGSAEIRNKRVASLKSSLEEEMFGRKRPGFRLRWNPRGAVEEINQRIDVASVLDEIRYAGSPEEQVTRYWAWSWRNQQLLQKLFIDLVPRDELRTYTRAVDGASYSDHFRNKMHDSIGAQRDYLRFIAHEIATGRIVQTEFAERRVSEPVSEGNYKWQSDCLRVFVSHNWSKRELAIELQQELNRFQIDAFVAHSDIEPAADWIRVITDALLSADAFVALLSDDFHTSNWTDQEVGAALGRQLVIVPVRIGTIVPHGFISRYQALLWTTPLEVSEELVAIFLRDKARAPLIGAIVRRIECSADHWELRGGLELLKKLPFLDRDLGDRVLAVVERFVAVRGAADVFSVSWEIFQQHRLDSLT
jgi:hypothetical protein